MNKIVILNRGMKAKAHTPIAVKFSLVADTTWWLT